jgi:hypothetical protein
MSGGWRIIDSKFGTDGLPDDDRACLFQAADHGRVVGRDKIGKQRGTRRRFQPSRVYDVFTSHRDTMEWSSWSGCCEFFIEVPRLPQRLFSINGHPGVESGLKSINLLQESLDKLDTGELACPNEPGSLLNGQQLERPHLPLLKAVSDGTDKIRLFL